LRKLERSPTAKAATDVAVVMGPAAGNVDDDAEALPCTEYTAPFLADDDRLAATK
jgi:hypothetical protein